jgi:nitroreductase/dihydropteridine reductase
MEIATVKLTDTLNLNKLTEKGHYTKAFLQGKSIPGENLDELLNFIHSVGTSVNIQATRYFVIESSEMKAAIADGMIRSGATMNEHKVRNASHVIVCATMTSVPDEYLNKIHRKEEMDGRFATPELKQTWVNVVRGWIDMHRYDVKDLNHWMEKQTYLVLGAAMVAAESLGINVSPLEGFDSKAVDALLGLREKGLTATVLLSLGYRDEAKDFAFKLPKSRLPKEEIFKFY